MIKLNNNEKEFLKNMSELSDDKLNDLSKISLEEHFYLGKKFRRFKKDNPKDKRIEVRSKLDEFACNKFRDIPDQIVLKLYYGEELSKEDLEKGGC